MSSTPLLKALTECGIGSRRWAADAIRKGMVEINGEIAEDFHHPVNLAVDRVLVNGHLVDLKPSEIVYLMLNKPRGVLSTTSDDRGRRTVLDILPGQYRHLRLHPVGRLDLDSIGLLLLTNDGKLTYQLTHPRFEHEKEYLVHIDGSLQLKEKRKLEQGINLEDGLTYPAKVKEIKSTPPFNYSITIHEGRKRQVHRMVASLGYHVMALKRIRIGRLSLGNLKEGDTRQLGAQEIRLLLGEKKDGGTRKITRLRRT
ncbi:pseudouridine synthase [Chloroflexota bacterium]